VLKNPIICAFDTKDITKAKDLATELEPYIGAVKLGLEFFTAHGTEGLSRIADCGLPIFLDLKFHDIPNTVREAVTAATIPGVSILTIHTSGGSSMMRAAAEAAAEAADKQNIAKPIIAGVTVLTSMDQADLEELGITDNLENHVNRLALLAKNSNLDGIVCSSHELKKVKALCGKNFITIVPGIRTETSDSHDQKRVTTPLQAIENGADFLVIGRPITQSKSPKDAARTIAASIANIS
jgi:orotidine-5'-phosphate decarboxylase